MSCIKLKFTRAGKKEEILDFTKIVCRFKPSYLSIQISVCHSKISFYRRYFLKSFILLEKNVNFNTASF